MPLVLWDFIIDCSIYTLFISLNIFITHKIFSNLYQCGVVNIRNSNVCRIKFSNKLNWIIQPSRPNKIYALLTTAINTTNYFTQLVMLLLFLSIALQYPNNPSNRYLCLIMDSVYAVLKAWSRIFYFLFIVSNLEYHMNAHTIFESAISKKLWKITKYSLYYLFFHDVMFGAAGLIDGALYGFEYFDGRIKGCPYKLLFTTTNLIIITFTEFTLFYLYHSDLKKCM